MENIIGKERGSEHRADKDEAPRLAHEMMREQYGKVGGSKLFPNSNHVKVLPFIKFATLHCIDNGKLLLLIRSGFHLLF